MKPNTEMVTLIAHLVITIFVIGAYVYLKMSNVHNEETFQPLLFVIVGYWFGSGGSVVLNKKEGDDG